MKLKNIHAILIMASSLCFPACNSDLEQYPLDSISPNTFFNTGNDLKLYTNSFYDMLPSAEGVYNEAIDNVVKQDLADELQGGTRRIVPESGGGWSWGDLRNINFYLENSHKCANEADRNRYDAVARFFRAYFYFEKVKRFGDVPWYSRVLSDKDKEGLTKPRDKRELVMDSVMADINFAVRYLPDTKKVNEITRWTALALKSRICLFEGTFRKYHTELTLPDAVRFLDDASTAAQEVMEKSGYKIHTTGNPESDYLNFFASLTAMSDEVILAHSFSDELQVYHNLNYYTMTASYGRPGLEKRMVNSYLTRDGKRFTDLPGYDEMGFFEETQNRDPRLSQTVRTPGYMRIGGNTTLVPEFGSTVTGYQLIKFVANAQYDMYDKSVTDMPLFRYAEVLLNYAEAKAERGTLTQEDLDKSIKLIRDRVGMPNINLSEANVDPDPYQANLYKLVSGTNKGVILEIRRERRVELVMESFRWDDILRWKEGQTLKEQFKGLYFPGLGTYDLDQDGNIDICIYKDTKPEVVGKKVQFLKLNGDITLEKGDKGNIVVNPHISKAWNDARDYFYPIPIQERKLNPNLTQNKGWDDGL